MEIPIINIFNVLKEIDTFSAPLHCTCRDSNGDFAKYYIKYVLDKDEYCGLVYEIVCNKLAEYFNINTPSIAFAIAGEIVENNAKISRNYLLTPESICFASKEIENHRMISDADEIKNKTTFNTFLNPEQFLKIGIFDLWVAHDDRNSINYNLLTGMSSAGNTLYSIDNYHCFGGEARFNKDFYKLGVYPYKSILTTAFGISLQKFLVDGEIITNIVEEFSNVDLYKVKVIIENVFKQLPKYWKFDPNLQVLIIDFLCNEDRNQQVIENFKHLTTS